MLASEEEGPSVGTQSFRNVSVPSRVSPARPVGRGNVSADLRGLRLAVFMTWPQPFQMPIFRVLRDDYGIEVDYYCLREESSRGWGDSAGLYPITSMAGVVRFGKHEVTAPPFRLFAAIARGRYDAAVIGGWERGHHVALHVLCARRDVPVLVGSDMRGGVGGRANRPRPVLRSRVRKALLSWILTRASVGMATGQAAADWFRAIGSPSLVTTGFFGVDSDLFCPSAKDQSQDGLRVLYVGRFVERKRVADAVEAIASLVRRGVPAGLTLVGDGPSRPALEQLVCRRALNKHVRFLGPVPHSAVAGLMKHSNVFVFPCAEEPWGLALIEAAAAGNILVASEQVGAVHDVLSPGRNGYVHATGDVPGLVECLLRVWSDLQAGRGAGMSSVSRRHACQFSFKQCARNYADAILSAIGGGRKLRGAGGSHA